MKKKKNQRQMENKVEWKEKKYEEEETSKGKNIQKGWTEEGKKLTLSKREKIWRLTRKENRETAFKMDTH